LSIKVPEGLNNYNNTSEVHYCTKGQNKTPLKKLDDFKSQRDGLFVITRDVQFELRRSGLKRMMPDPKMSLLRSLRFITSSFYYYFAPPERETNF